MRIISTILLAFVVVSQVALAANPAIIFGSGGYAENLQPTGIKMKSGAVLNDNTTSISTIGDFVVFEGTPQEIPVGEELLEVLSTGITAPNGLSINGGDNTKFDIAPTEAHITDRVLGTFVDILYAGSTLNSPAVTNGVTYIFLDNTGSVHTQTARPTGEDLREKVYLGRSVSVGGVIVQVLDEPVVVENVASSLYDLSKALRIFNEEGNVLSPNGVNLSLDKTIGDVFSAGANYTANRNEPHRVEIAACTVCTFAYFTQTVGSTQPDTTLIDPANYDVAGTITAVPGASKTSTVQKIYLFPSGSIRVAYGQNTYTNLTLAVQAIGTESFVTNANVPGNGVLMAVLVMRKDATDLSDTDQAKLIYTSRFGESGVGSGGIAVGTLQTSYDNSTAGEMTLDTTRNGFEVRDNATPIGSDLFSVSNSTGATDYLSVEADLMQTITNFEVWSTGHIRLPNGTTAQRPTPTNGQIRYNSDEELYEAYREGAWREFAKDQNPINYILNGGAEKGDSGWARYDDVTGGVPIDGTGGAASGFVLDLNLSPALEGTKSFEFETTANAQGKGFSYDFAIGSAKTYKKLTIKFDYNVDGAWADDDMVVYVYDIDNAALLTPDSVGIKNSGLNEFFITKFQSTDSLNYRLIFHTAATRTGLILGADNISVSYEKNATNSTITDFVPSTGTLSDATNVSESTFFEKREGDSLIYTGHIKWSAAGAGSSFHVTIPSEYTIDLTKLVVASLVPQGAASWYNPSALTSHFLNPYVQTSTAIRFADTSGSNVVWDGSQANTNDILAFEIRIPIVGWGSTQVVADEYANREIFSKVHSSTTTIGTGNTKIVFNSTEVDKTASMSSSTFTAPARGLYEVKYKMYLLPSVGMTQLFTWVTVDGVTGSNRRVVNFVDTANPNELTAQASDMLELEAGQTLEVYGVASGASVTLGSVSGSVLDSNSFSVTRIKDSRSMLGGETAFMRAQNSAGQVIDTATSTVITNWTTEEDTHNAFNTTTGIYTCPVKGIMHISANIFLNNRDDLAGPTGWELGENMTMRVKHNGTANTFMYYKEMDTSDAVADDIFQWFSGVDSFSVEAGDTISVEVRQTSGKDIPLYSSGAQDYNTLKIRID